MSIFLSTLHAYSFPVFLHLTVKVVPWQPSPRIFKISYRLLRFIIIYGIMVKRVVHPWSFPISWWNLSETTEFGCLPSLSSWCPLSSGSSFLWLVRLAYSCSRFALSFSEFLSLRVEFGHLLGRNRSWLAQSAIITHFTSLYTISCWRFDPSVAAWSFSILSVNSVTLTFFYFNKTY